MILGYHAIRDAFRLGGPWTAYNGNTPINVDSLKINPNSVDVTLGNIFLIPEYTEYIDPHDKHSIKYNGVFERDRFILNPGQCVLACVNERFKCDTPYLGGKFVPMYEGRSTVGRLFVSSHVTAGFGDYGFEGAFTLELVNHNPKPIILYPGMRIGQVYWIQCQNPIDYTGSYSVDHNTMPVAPKLGKDRF